MLSGALCFQWKKMARGKNRKSIKPRLQASFSSKLGLKKRIIKWLSWWMASVVARRPSWENSVLRVDIGGGAMELADGEG